MKKPQRFSRNVKLKLVRNIDRANTQVLLNFNDFGEMKNGEFNNF